MSGPIQIVPPGLLGYLNIKNAGNNPSDLLDTVQPTLDLRDWWFQARLEVTTVTQSFLATTASVGFKAFTTNPVTVPQGQMWYVTEYVVAANISTAADTITMAAALETDLVNLTFCTLGPNERDVINARARFLVARADRPFWLPAGSLLGAVVYDCLAAVNITVLGGLRFARLTL